MAPGALSRSHAQLLVSTQHTANPDFAIDSENRCAACHSELDGSVLSTAAAKQSDLCLKCHSQEMPDASHGSPHDLHGRSLEELIERGDRTNIASSWTKFISQASYDWKAAPTECSQCHREHQGASHNLQEMTSERCQACHRNPFQSFAKDHPEFKNYPYGQTNSIEFDHVKHRDLHYSKKGTSFDCKTCHIQSDQVGAVGQVFRSVSFEKACASCHTEPIKSAIQDGLIVLQIPSINRNELLVSGTDIGDWPKQASQLTDGVIPPIMRMLIESEPGGAALLHELPASGRLVELEPTNEQHRATLLKLTATTKKLFRKLANEGQRGLRSSVEKLVTTQGSTSRDQTRLQSSPWLDQLANGLPPDLFRAAWIEWFDDSRTTPVISQSGILEPNPIRPSAVRFSSTIRQMDDDLLEGNGSLLAPKDDDLLNSDPNSLLKPQGADLLQSDTFKDPRAWDQLAFGGWMIDRQRMAIVYIPRGHADEWLSRWIELEEMRSRSSDASRNSAPLAKIELAKQCRQCHSLQTSLATLSSPLSPSSETQRPTDRAVAFRRANANTVNAQTISEDMLAAADVSNACWRSKKRPANLRQITKFDHTPHLTLPSISDCRTCHQLLDTNAMQSASNEFAPMQKSQCASCHQPKAAGDSCTQCHNYHVGTNGWSAR